MSINNEKHEAKVEGTIILVNLDTTVDTINHVTLILPPGLY